MIDRLVVQITDRGLIKEELDYLDKYYSHVVDPKYNNGNELVFLAYANKVCIYKNWSSSYETWDTSVCLPSFQDIPKLHLLQSVGLSDKEIQEYFPWRSQE